MNAKPTATNTSKFIRNQNPNSSSTSVNTYSRMDLGYALERMEERRGELARISTDVDTISRQVSKASVMKALQYELGVAAEAYADAHAEVQALLATAE